MRLRSRLPRGALIAAGPVLLVVAGFAGYLGFGYSPWVAVAMTLLTLTTVGLASGEHLSTGVLVFTAGLALLGVSVFVVILGLAASAIMEGRVGLFSRSRRMRQRIGEPGTRTGGSSPTPRPSSRCRPVTCSSYSARPAT